MSYANFLCTQMHMTNEQMRALKPNMCKYMHSEKSAKERLGPAQTTPQCLMPPCFPALHRGAGLCP